MRLILCLGYIVLIGILSHYIGESLPRSWFNPEKPPFSQWRIETDGRLYRRLQVHAWKDKLPDMSRVATKMTRKSISLTGSASDAWDVVIETCVAEVVHLVLMLLSFVIYLIFPSTLGAIIAAVYALSHIPFIVIQRYNRPTLITLTRRLKQREEKIKHAHTDTLSQHR